MKKYKVMAYVMSSGLWDTLGPISLEQVIGVEDPDLENDLRDWQASYDDQFKRYPYNFDWHHFNQVGQELTERIKSKLPADAQIRYEPSDDREFFSQTDFGKQQNFSSSHHRELSLRERKRSLLYHHPIEVHG